MPVPSTPADPPDRPDPPDPSASELRLPDRLRAGLRDAMLARDPVAVGALRTALAAIENAEAPPIEAIPSRLTEPRVGQLVEHPRLVRSDEQQVAVLQAEIADRRDAIEQYLQGGQDQAAADLEAQIVVLQRYL